jgi:hypothetical protein
MQDGGLSTGSEADLLETAALEDLSRMDELFQLHPNGVFLRREALLLGYEDRDLAHAVRRRQIVRIRQGTYCPAQSWQDADAGGRHLLTAQGVALTHEHRVALSHTTGALAWGLRLWRPELARVHVTRLAGTTGRVQPDVIYHRHAWDPEGVWAQEEHLLLDPVTCGLQAAARTSVTQGVVILDSLIDLDLCDEATLSATYATMSRSPFTRRLQVAVRLTRRGAESVGESLTRDLFFKHHLPEPVLQYKVYDGSRLVGITDFAWPEYGLLGEFDGKIKYGRLLKPGQDPGEVVFREKRREDEIREVTGMGMIRYIFGDLYVPLATAARTRRMLARPHAA